MILLSILNNKAIEHYRLVKRHRSGISTVVSLLETLSVPVFKCFIQQRAETFTGASIEFMSICSLDSLMIKQESRETPDSPAPMNLLIYFFMFLLKRNQANKPNRCSVKVLSGPGHFRVGGSSCLS